MSAREVILAAVRGCGPTVRELPYVPDFCGGHDDLVGRFAAALARLDGKLVTEPSSGIPDWFCEVFPDARRICSAVREVNGNISPAGFSDWAAPADIDVTVVRTSLGVAETGSILLTEHELEVTTAAVLAQHLVVLLDSADIVENIHDAYRHPAFQHAAYAVLLSGPSGSADIGGVTVHPAQGVTTLTVVLAPRSKDDAGVPEAGLMDVSAGAKQEHIANQE
jgi:L-lactate dehydrogenase complex protein LldG